MKNTKQDSGAHGGAETSIAISMEDMLWIRNTKNGKSQKDRLHEILENYRRAGLDAQYSVEAHKGV